MPKPLKKRVPRDENESAFASVQRVIQMVEPERAQSFETQFRAHMSKLGKKGGKASGAKRMENLSLEQRREIASKGAKAMWAKRRKAEAKD